MNPKTLISFILMGVLSSSMTHADEVFNKQSKIHSDRTMMTATGKQRLSKKWQDETRIDDCKVPEEYRTDKSRSVSCDHKHK